MLVSDERGAVGMALATMLQGVGKVDTPIEWGAVVILTAGAVAALARIAMPLFKGNKNGPSGDGLNLMLGKLDSTLSQIVTQQNGVMLAINGLAIALTQLNGKLENMPTKMDITEAHRETRHDWRAALQVAQTNIIEAVERAKDGK